MIDKRADDVTFGFSILFSLIFLNFDVLFTLKNKRFMLFQCESYLLKAIRDFTTKYSACKGKRIIITDHPAYVA